LTQRVIDLISVDMSPSVLDRGARATASLSQGAIAERTSAPESRAPASDLLERDLESSGSWPPPPRSPGMHLGHDLLHAVTFAVVLFATLLLNAIHC